MTLKTQLVVDLEFTSSCSEADLYGHVKNVVGQLKHYVKNTPNDSWNAMIRTSWDESFRVESRVNITESKIE